MLYKANRVPADAASSIAAAGGTLVYGYDQIGVAVARSESAGFSARLIKDSHVEGVSATAGFATRLGDQVVELAEAPDLAAADAWGDPMSVNQWDMLQIHVPEAQAINAGDPSVVVGDIDTGLDYTHPDLAANVDFADSVSCVGGAPNQDPAAWMDDNGHGTHTAGTIAAAKNGIGIVGVAPNVKIAAIKAGNAAGYFYPEAVVCSFMWAGAHNIAVTNNSYFADPWLFNCRNDAGQRAIWKAEQRAIRFAMSQGVTVVAAMGNENKDLSKTNVDTISPDNGTPLTREVTNACLVDPSRDPGRDRRDGRRQPGTEVVLLQLRRGGDPGGGPRRRQPLPADAGGDARHGAVDLPGQPLRLPAGHVDGQPARGWRGGADRQPVRPAAGGGSPGPVDSDIRSPAMPGESLRSERDGQLPGHLPGRGGL